MRRQSLDIMNKRLKSLSLFFVLSALICRVSFASYQPEQLITQGGVKKSLVTDLNQEDTLDEVLTELKEIKLQLMSPQDADINILDGEGKGVKAHVHCFQTVTGKHCGIIALTEPFRNTVPVTKFFINDTVGNALNQDVSFGTTGNIIHDGGTSASVDTGTANVDNENSLEDTGGLWGTGGDAELVQIGMTVERTTGSAYARISAVTGTVLDLTTIASKGATSADIFPDGNEAYIINAVWTGTATTGTWDFSSGGLITQAAGNDGDQADIAGDADDESFADDFTALTGTINLNTYSEVNHNIEVQMTLDGIDIGDSILLNDFIDTGDFGAQQFSVSIDSLAIGGLLTNGVRFTIARSGGSKPAFTLDDIRLEVSGTPLVFSLNLSRREVFHIQQLVFSYKDNIDSIQTVTGATENVTNLSIDPDTILGVSALTNGFVIKRTKGGKTLFSATIKSLGGQISGGALPDRPLTAPDGSSTLVVLRVIFNDPLILTGEFDDTLTITINDNMSALEQFTVTANGGLEINGN